MCDSYYAAFKRTASPVDKASLLCFGGKFVCHLAIIWPLQNCWICGSCRSCGNSKCWLFNKSSKWQPVVCWQLLNSASYVLCVLFCAWLVPVSAFHFCTLKHIDHSGSCVPRCWGSGKEPVHNGTEKTRNLQGVENGKKAKTGKSREWKMQRNIAPAAMPFSSVKMSL